MHVVVTFVKAIELFKFTKLFISLHPIDTLLSRIYLQHFLWDWSRYPWLLVNIVSGNGLLPSATSHHPNQCWPSFMTQDGIIKPGDTRTLTQITGTNCSPTRWRWVKVAGYDLFWISGLQQHGNTKLHLKSTGRKLVDNCGSLVFDVTDENKHYQISGSHSTTYSDLPTVDKFIVISGCHWRLNLSMQRLLW